MWASFGKELSLQYNEQENDLELSEEQRTKYDAHVTAVQEAYDLTNDFAHVFKISKKGISELKNITLTTGKPCNVMLYPKAQNISEAFETVGKPAAFENKYDGFRLQIHKNNETILLFTRRLEDVTKQFPEVVNRLKNSVQGNTFIIDAEAVGIDLITQKYLPFQNISQRIKRKYDIHATAEKFPVVIFAFDILFYNNESLINKPFSQRRQLLESIIRPQKNQVELAEQQIIEDEQTAEAFYKKALASGYEGAMIKNLNGIYKPGVRVGYGVKLKPIMETLDVAIVGAEWGEGKRSDWLSSFTIAVQNEKNELLEIGKVGTGIKEKDEEGFSFGQFTELLKPHITKQEGKTIFVKPTIVIEVAYEEIQQSPTYNSGYALRFPRFVRIRDDKSIANSSTTIDVERLYKEQRGRDT